MFQKAQDGGQGTNDCKRCKLSALCLPIGTDGLAKKLWRCNGCKRYFPFVSADGSTKDRKGVDMNEKCVSLEESLVTVVYGRCYNCRLHQTRPSVTYAG